MRTRNKMVALTIIVFFMLIPAFNILAATANDVNKQMRDAQNLYFKGKAAEADDVMKKIEEMVAEILNGSDAAEIQKVKRLDGRLKKLRRDIDKKLGKSADAASDSKTDAKATVSTSTTGESNELPSHVISDLKGVERYLATVQQNLDNDEIRWARRSLDSAIMSLQQTGERKKRYITPEHPQYKELQSRIDKLDAKISAAEKVQADQKAAAEVAAANAKAESDKWVAKLKPYVTGRGTTGYNPERYFVAGYTEDQKEMAKQTAIYAMVADDMKAYRAVGLGDNATDELRSIIRDIEYKLKSFEESMASTAEWKLKEATRQIDYMVTWHNKEAQKIGSNELPNSMSKLTFESARRDLDGAARLLGENDPRVKSLNAKYDDVLALDAKLAKARIAQTRMIPDKFEGAEKGALKKKAEEILQNAKPGVKILKTTAITPDWQEESVIEWTDTSRSALLHRVTRSVSVQVAGKSGSETTLYTLHIAKDRRTDGSWSPLRGHIMFKDPILEENVGK